MAALTAVQIELANSLTQDELPTKLRCAICSKLAINAFRLPCCETAICENCQSTLPSSCPVCEHSPVSGADCTVYKSLRTTIRVFLKTEERKREAARPKPATEPVPSPPVQATPTPTQSEAPTAPPQESAVIQDGESASQSVAPEKAHSTTESNDESANIQEPSNDPQAPPETSAEDQRRSKSLEGEEAKSLVQSGQIGNDTLPIQETVENDQDQDDAVNEQSAQSGVGPMNGTFMNYGGGGDMNQMQMMMAMQNGMNPAAFGSFPMMGMDMGMNPMMMQNMFMNGGFGAQGMNGMSMNMGINGMNSGGNDWNGQQSWNVGQDNFNPNAPSMGNGDFGNFNSGFRNYGQQNQFNDYRRGNYGFRGRGRGRNFYGGYNRGGYHQQGFNNMNGNWAEQMNQYSGGSGSQSTANGNEAANDQGTESKSGKEVDEFGRTIRPGSGQDVQAVENGQGDGHDAAEGPDNLVSHEKSASADVQQSGEAHNDLANGNGDVSSAGQRPIPHGPASLIGRQSPMVEAPLNAPTGPKAMRQGLPNTSFHRLKARGLIGSDQGPSSGADAQAVASPQEDRPKSRSSSPHSRKDLGRHHREHGRDRDLDEKSRGRHGERSRSRSPSRSRSRDRKESRRHRRHRSESLSGEGHGDEHHDRKHKSRRKSTREDDYSSRSKDDKYAPASRSPSPDDREHKRSTHRSHRDRDEKRRDREKDKERESDHDRHRKSGHRSHRDRDRDRDYDRDHDRERQKDRDHERRKDRRERDKERRHRGGKSSAAPLTPIEPSDKAFNPPTGPRGSFSIKGASNKPASGAETKGGNSRPSDSSRNDNEPSRRASQSSTAGQKGPPTGPSKDPHTLEREARDRERLLKEAQRIAGLAGLAGKKRGRDGGEERSGRRKSRRSEAVNTDEEEARMRMRRLEAEREGRRWE